MINVLAIMLLLFSVWFFANRWNRPHFGVLHFQDKDKSKPAGLQISVTTWNIGFAALGARADLFIDGGVNLRALSRDQIALAANTIADRLATKGTDIVLLQENAKAGYMTHGVDVHGKMHRSLFDYVSCFWPDFRTLIVPKPFNFNHGITSFSKLGVSAFFTLRMPQDSLYYYSFLKKYYGAVVQKNPIEGQDIAWVVINIHLSAFEEPARKGQLAALLDYAQAEYQAGNHVVIGGDWNMRLVPVVFAHTTPKDGPLKVYDFPQGALPKGWVLGADMRTATLRSLNAPFVKGRTYTSIVDGFVVSPNVRIDSVCTDDLGFEHTDHHPVTGRFSALG